MRSSVAIAAFAAGALAVPFNNKRALVQTAYDIVYVTDIVTVTGGAPQPAAYTPESTPSSAPAAPEHYGHHNWHPSSVAYTTIQAQPTEAPESTSEPAPTTYQAPATYAAPSSSAAPATTEAATGAASGAVGSVVGAAEAVCASFK